MRPQHNTHNTHASTTYTTTEATLRLCNTFDTSNRLSFLFPQILPTPLPIACVQRYCVAHTLKHIKQDTKRDKHGDTNGYPGTVLRMQYHSTLAVPDFFFAPSDEKTVIGLKVGGVRPLDGKLRMSAFCRCVDWPKKRMDRPFFFDSPAPTPFQTTFCSSLSATFLTLVGY